MAAQVSETIMTGYRKVTCLYSLLCALQYVLAWYHKTLINMSFNFHHAKALSGFIYLISWISWRQPVRC